jgi:hypothetical protein
MTQRVWRVRNTAVEVPTEPEEHVEPCPSGVKETPEREKSGGVLKSPGCLVRLGAGMAGSGTKATVGPKRPLVRQGVDDGGKRTKLDGEDIPAVEPGFPQQKVELVEVAEPSNTVTNRWRCVRKGEKKLSTGSEHRGKILQAGSGVSYVLEHVERENRVIASIEQRRKLRV